MTSLLIINPNTSADLSALLLEHAQATAPPGAQAAVCTARFGARYISGEVAAVIASHAALDAWAVHVAQHGMPRAVLLACFGDPGLFALRALAPVPVLGLAQASMQSVSSYGRFVIVTGGAAWAPMLVRLAHALGLSGALAGVHTVPQSGGTLAADPEQAVPILRQAVAEALTQWPDARAVLLGGAGLAGFSTAVGRGMTVPVLDSVGLALQAAWSASRVPASEDARPIEAGPWQGLSPELAALLGAADRVSAP
jgi:Asp/Glu/hydantoin racemase